MVFGVFEDLYFFKFLPLLKSSKKPLYFKPYRAFNEKPISFYGFALKTS